MITVIAVGKKHEDWVSGGIKHYQTRCKQPWSFEWQLIPHSKLEGQQARQEESERILARLHPQDFVILLGVSATLTQRAHLVWSLSPLVFPHQLVRLILAEQLYRAQEITRGGKYHHQ